MGIVLYDIVRNPKWVEYDKEQNEDNASALVSKVDGEHAVLFMSVHGGLSIPDIVQAIGRRSPITELDVTSLTVGMGALDTLIMMCENGELRRGGVTFYLSSVMTSNNTNKKYGYDRKFFKTLEDLEWDYCELNNHSKICICRCEDGSEWVVETSANFNKNPKMEQFRVMQDGQCYQFYKEILESVKTPDVPAKVKTLDYYLKEDNGREFPYGF